MGQISVLIFIEMKKTLTIISAILAVSISLFAQDARQRTVSTIVSDVLAQLPAQNYAEFTSDMADIAKSAPQSVEIIAGMFQAPEKGANNKLEYAISGAVSFANTPGNEQYRGPVSEGLTKAIENAKDETAKAFFQAQLGMLGKPGCCRDESCGKGDCKCDLSDKELLAKAKELLASGESNKKCQAIWIMDKVNGAKNLSNVIAALKDSDDAYRMTALKTTESYSDESTFAKLAKAYKSVGSDAKDDILYWLGEQKAAGQLPFILKQIGGSNSTEAIAAAGKIGGEAAAEALIARIGTEDDSAAAAALNCFNGDIRSNLLNAIEKAGSNSPNSLLSLASARHLTEAAPAILKLAESSKEAKYALKGVATTKNLNEIAGLLDKASAEDIATLQEAVSACVKGKDGNEQFRRISNAMYNAANKARFYAPIASTSSDLAVAFLAGASAEGSKDALKALCTIDNGNATPALLSFAEKDSDCLSRYIQLVSESGMDEFAKTNAFIKALAIAKDNKALSTIISKLAGTANKEALDAVVPYLDNKDLAIKAADAVKAIGCKVPTEIPYDELEKYFGKAMAILSASGNPDDGYSVDAMKHTLNECKPYPVSELTAEEKEAGFVMLYDGTDLDNWIGDKQTYVSMNGAINVFANSGGGGNLYTAKEYHNFIYRFEFCFLRPAVNNGVGVRTPEGVDAAYGAMCEVQILDHDDPVYANLREYQTHGSVYGVIPAKRLKHRPIGEWSQEEIKVVGNHITVTVNGEVLVDGDIKEACQGHNVAPDGSDHNPYTVDHRNHPGMFNEKGHVSFCGHGRGLQFRNIRILPLD